MFLSVLGESTWSIKFATIQQFILFITLLPFSYMWKEANQASFNMELKKLSRQV